MWLKIRLKNEYYAKMDFPQEKVFIAHALLKNKVGKMVCSYRHRPGFVN